MVQETFSNGFSFWDNNNDKMKKMSNGFVEFSVLDNQQLQNSINTTCVKDYDYLDFDNIEADSKRIRLKTASNQQQDGRTINPFGGQSTPLGLTLRKTPSFIDLIENIVSQGKKASSLNQTNNNGSPNIKATNFPPEHQSEKLKASNFRATLLRIGDWKRVAKHEGDLVAKCYYAKRKIVWEVLDGGLKSKIEIQWSNISAIRAVFNDNEPGTLELELSSPPLFYKETNPQPRKHTLWQPSIDFTGGQAPICRRHYVVFPEGTLEKHYEKLLQSDKRLLMLSQSPFPSSKSPFFQPKHDEYQDLYLNFDGNQEESMLRFSQPDIQNHTFYPYYEVPKFIPRPPITPRNQIAHIQAMGDLVMEENMGYQAIQKQRNSFTNEENQDWGYMSRGEENQVQNPPLVFPMNQVQVHSFVPRDDLSQQNSFGNTNNTLDSNWWQLNAIANHLLHEPIAPIFNDDPMVLAKIRSMDCLLEAAGNEQNLCHHNETCLEYPNCENSNSWTSPSSTNQSHGSKDGILGTHFHVNKNTVMELQSVPPFPYLELEASPIKNVGIIYNDHQVQKFW